MIKRLLMRLLSLMANPKYEITFMMKSGQSFTVRDIIRWKFVVSDDGSRYEDIEYVKLNPNEGFGVTIQNLEAFTYRIHGWTFSKVQSLDDVVEEDGTKEE